MGCYYQITGSKRKFQRYTTARKAARGKRIWQACREGNELDVRPVDARGRVGVFGVSRRKGRCTRWSKGRKRCLKRTKR